MLFEVGQQERPQPVAMESRVDGDAHHPGVAARTCGLEAGMRQQRLGQQMAAWTPPPGPDRLGQLVCYLSFPGHQRHPEQMRALLQQVDVEGGALQQVAQIARRGLVVGQHQQAEHPMEQFLVGSQCILLEPAPARLGGGGRRLDLGVEAEQPEHQRLQRIPTAPADRLGQVDLLPAGRLAIEYPLEAQVKTAPRTLVAVLRGGEDDATVPGQHGLQQRGGNGGRFVHQQQVGLQRLVHQPIR